MRGALFLRDLRAAVGDEAFFAFLRDYADRNAGGMATGDGFFELLGQHTTVDLTPIIAEYFGSR
jgi:aminopeptidase N